MKTLGRCGLLDWSRSKTWREAEAQGDGGRCTWNCTCSMSTDLAESADPDREGEGPVLFTGERDRLTGITSLPGPLPILSQRCIDSLENNDLWRL